MRIETGVLITFFLLLILPAYAEVPQNLTQSNQNLQNNLEKMESTLIKEQNNLNEKFENKTTDLSKKVVQIGVIVNDSENKLLTINSTFNAAEQEAKISTSGDRLTNYILSATGIILAGVGIGYALHSTKELKRFINWGRYVQHATTYFNSRDWHNARIYYDKALELTPKHVDLLNNAGASCSRLKNDKEALGYYEKVLEVEPRSAVALNNKGTVLMALKQYQEAETVFIDALDANPDNLDALNNMGLLYQNNLEYDHALRFFDGVLEIDPNDITAWFNKGQVMSEQEQWESAVFFYDKALGIDRDFRKASPPDLEYSKILQQKGNALRNLKRFDEAVACYKKALVLSPLDSDVIVNLGAALGELRKFEEAITYFDQYLVTNPFHVDILRLKGDCLESISKSKDALDCYNKALDLDPLSAISLNNKGKSLMGLGKIIQALLCFKESFRLKPNVNALFNEAIILGKHKDNRIEADEYFRRVIEISNPHDFEDSYHMGLSHVFRGEYDQAIAVFDALTKIDPSDLRVLRSKANAFFRADRYNDTIDTYNKILQINFQDVEALSGKGIALVKEGLHERAIETCFDRLLLIQPLNPDGLYNKGVALFRQRKFNQALEFFERALEVEPQSIPILFDEASCLMELGKYEKSLNQFQKILDIDNTDEIAMYGMSLAFAKLEDYTNAWLWWDRHLEAKGMGRDFLDRFLLNLRTRGFNSIRIIDRGNNSKLIILL